MKYLLILLCVVGCGGRGRQGVAVTPAAPVVASVKEVDIRVNPTEKTSYMQGDEIKIGFKTTLTVDSVAVVSSDKSLAISLLHKDSVSGEWTIKTSEDSKVGDVPYKFDIYSGGQLYSRSATYNLLPKSAPKNYNAVIKEVIPINSYFLQGFEIVGDTTFFSSGTYGKSFIEAVDFPSKKVLRVQDIDKKYFAEGLTVLNDKIYVLTWESRKCLIYDRRTLKKIKEAAYPYAEGWGLTNDGKYLYMSDGTKNIYKLDPETFKEIDRVEVASNIGSVEYLNELEWIDGEIWANVFTYNYILRIDPATGAIKGIVRCNALVEQITRSSSEDFLNGIAFDKKRNIIYLSGKNWKKIFKVAIVNIP